MVFGMLIAMPAFATHMGIGESGELVDRSSANSTEHGQRASARLDNATRAGRDIGRGKPMNPAAAVSERSAPDRGHAEETGSVPRRDIVSDSTESALDLSEPYIAPQPVESATINARIPGLSDDALVRFKNRMYRKDI